jgi:antitoxin Phd
MTKMDTTTARKTFASTVNRVAFGGERIALYRHGKGVVALVPIEDLETLQELEDRIDLREARKALKNPKASAWEDVKARLGY